MSLDLLLKGNEKHKIAQSGTSHCPGCSRCNHLKRNFQQYFLSKVKTGVSKNVRISRPR